MECRPGGPAAAQGGASQGSKPTLHREVVQACRAPAGDEAALAGQGLALLLHQALGEVREAHALR